jgi:hypothetical protein
VPLPEGCQLPLQCIADANRISRLDEEQNEYEYVDEVLTITHALATRKTVSSSGLFFLLMLDFYAFWGFLEVTGFSFEIPEGVQAGVTMKAGCLCFPFACAGAKSTRFQVKRLETFLLNRFCKEHGALRCLDPTM